ncbi:MAG: hypothetical protein ACI31M_04095 [Bacilli bacterium]
MKEFRLSIDWKDLIIKIILLILFIVLLVWLIPKPQQIDTFYDRVFNDNMQTMKEAAKSYYTVDKLPVNIGDNIKMTLKQMIDKHMVLEFVDKDNNTCNTDDSYVEVTKTGENEYVLKVNLKCGDQEDYILETIGCYDVCPNGECDTNSDIENVVEYQFMKEVPTITTTYSCPAGYTKKGNLCYKGGSSTTINATANYFSDSVLAVDAKKNTTGSYIEYADAIRNDNIVCPTGYESNGVQCVKIYKASANVSSGTFSCPAGYTLSGATCYKTYSASYANGSVNYTCPAGYELKGTACYKTISAKYVESSTSTSKSCPAGYSQSGNNCIKIINATSGSTSYKCNGTDKLEGTTCYHYTTVDANVNKTYGDWYVSNKYSTTATKATYSNDTEKLVYDGMTYKYTCAEISKCPVKAAHYNYTLYKRNVSTNATCANGTQPVNGKCTTVSTYTATKTTGNSTCPSGYSAYGNNQCISTVPMNVSSSTNNGYYTCSEGTLSGSSCILVAAATKKVSNGRYTCPSGGNLNGTLCRLSTAATSNNNGSVTLACPNGGSLDINGNCTTYTNGTKNTTYTCPAGYTKNGSGASTTCSKKVSSDSEYYCENKDAQLKGTKCYYTVKGNISGYSCPAGYTKNGTKCTKTNLISIKATAKQISTVSYKYTWSQSKTLEGWTATGKQRVVENTKA